MFYFSAVVFDDERFDHVGDVVDDGFQLFRIDVLAAGAEDHALAAAAQVQVAVVVDHADVAGLEPVVVGEGGLGGLAVLVVAQEDVFAADLDLARLLVGVLGVDADLAARHRHAAGAAAGLPPLGVGDDRGALRHAVADGEGEVDLAHELLDLRVEGGAAEDHLLEAAAEGVDQAVADLLADHLVHDGDAHQRLVTVHHGLDLGFVHLLEDQRHGDDHVGMDLGEGLHDHLRARGARQEVHVRADGHLEEELEHHAVHVGGRQHRDHLRLAGHLRLGHLAGEADVAPQRAVREHDALGEAGGAGSVVDHGKFLGLVLIII